MNFLSIVTAAAFQNLKFKIQNSDSNVYGRKIYFHMFADMYMCVFVFVYM